MKIKVRNKVLASYTELLPRSVLNVTVWAYSSTLQENNIQSVDEVAILGARAESYTPRHRSSVLLTNCRSHLVSFVIWAIIYPNRLLKYITALLVGTQSMTPLLTHHHSLNSFA